jgi:hypothetical protein
MLRALFRLKIFQTTINIPLQLVEGTYTKEDLYKPADKIVPPPSEELDIFRGLIGSAKVGNVNIGEGAAEVGQFTMSLKSF